MKKSSFADQFAGLPFQLDYFQSALTNNLSKDDKKQLSNMAIQVRRKLDRQLKDAYRVLDATAKLDPDIQEFEKENSNGLNVLGTVNVGLSLPSFSTEGDLSEEQVDKAIAKLEPFEDQAKNGKKLFDQLKDLRRKRRRFKSDVISGDWDTPLAKVLHEAKDYFLYRLQIITHKLFSKTQKKFDIEDFAMLAQTSKDVREALRNVPVQVDDGYDREVQDGRCKFVFSPLITQVRPLITTAEFRHYYTGRAKRLTVEFPLHLMPKLKELTFKSSGDSVYDINLHEEVLPSTLTSLKVEGCGYTPLSSLGPTKIHLPKGLCLDHFFPSLQVLILSDLTMSSEITAENPFLLPTHLKRLRLDDVSNLNSIEYAGSGLMEAVFVSMPKLALSEVPQGLKRLWISYKQFCAFSKLPSEIDALRFDFPLRAEYTDEVTKAIHEGIANRISHLPLLKSLDLEFIPLSGVWHSFNVHSLCCSSPERFGARSGSETTKIVVAPSVRRFAIIDFPKLISIEFQGEVEEIQLIGLRSLQKIVLPPSCRIFKVKDCTRLAEVVFDGCDMEFIVVKDGKRLDSVTAQNGARIPADLKSALDGHGYYPIGEDAFDIQYKTHFGHFFSESSDSSF